MGRKPSRGVAESSDDDTFKSFSDEYGSTTSGSEEDTDYSDGYTFSESENEEAEEESQTSCRDSVSEVVPKASPTKPKVAKLPQITSQGTPRKQNLSKPVPLPPNGVQSSVSVMSILSAIDSAVDAVVDTIIPRQEAKENPPKREKSPTRDVIKRESPERRNPMALIRTLSGRRSALHSSKVSSPKSKSSRVTSPKVASTQADTPHKSGKSNSKTTMAVESPKKSVGARMKNTFSPRAKEKEMKKNRAQDEEKEQLDKNSEEPNFFKKMGYSTFDWVSPTNAGDPLSEETEPKKRCSEALRKNKAYDGQVRDDQSVHSIRSKSSKKGFWKSSRSMKEESRDMPESEGGKTGSEWWGGLVGAFPGYEEESFDSHESSKYEEVAEAQTVRRKNLFRRRFSRKGDDILDDCSTNTSTKKPKTKTKIKWFGRKKDEELKKEYEGILY